jgi:hypothetical protein
VRSRKAKLNADRISELERKSGQQTMEIDFFKKSVAAFQKTSSASRRQRRHRLYEQIQEAGEAGAIVNRLCRAAGISRAGSPHQLKPKVNQTKSAVARPGQRKFLGFSFTGEREPRRRIAPKGHRSL